MFTAVAIFILLVEGSIGQSTNDGCPEFLTAESRTYPVGSTLQVPCPGSATVTYTVTCVGGIWDNSLGIPTCTGQIADTPPPPAATPAPPSNAANAVISTAMMCPFLPGLMKPQDAERQFPQGAVYEMTCTNGGGTFFATCQNQAWVYENNVCQSPGIIPPPATLPTIPSTPPPATIIPPAPDMMCPYLPGLMNSQDAGRQYPQGAVYEMTCTNGAGTFMATCGNGAWIYDVNDCQAPGIIPPPITQPPPYFPTGPSSGTIGPPSSLNCPYLPGYMLASDASRTFESNVVYRMICNPPNQARTFDATCTNGQWYGNRGTCSGGLFGSLFSGTQTAVQPAPAPVPTVPMKSCDYVPAVMLESDAGKSFPDGTHYRFRCLADSAVYTVHEAVCSDGTWYHRPNDCFVAPTQGSSLNIGGLEIPLLFFLL